eukprot:m.34062 g.34062  ORF g.34062 m.34062 type:complete len:289 (+) comp8662_c0_seq1:186-1052(+)
MANTNPSGILKNKSDGGGVKSTNSNDDLAIATALNSLGLTEDQVEHGSVEQLAAALKAADRSKAAQYNPVAVQDDEAHKMLKLITELSDEHKYDLDSSPTQWLNRWDLGVENMGGGEHYNPPTLVRQDHKSIVARFGKLWDAACQGQCDEWELSGTSYILALVVLLDQISRIMNYEDGERYANDFAALTFAECLVESKADSQFSPIERLFCYLPFLHAEDAEAQAKGEALFSTLADEHPSYFGGVFRRIADKASTNIEVLKKYKRFPQRNAARMRKSTADEIEFLKNL